MDVTATFATDHPVLIFPHQENNFILMDIVSPVSLLFPSVLLKCSPSYFNRLVRKGELVN